MISKVMFPGEHPISPGFIWLNFLSSLFVEADDTTEDELEAVFKYLLL